MSDEPRDIFGKIDALLGRRVDFAPTQPEAYPDDFPLLTEVVVPDSPGDSAHSGTRGEADSGANANASSGCPDEIAALESADLPDLGIIPPACDLDLFFTQLPPDPLEERLMEMVARQQAQLEALIRRVVREELERYLGAQSSPPPPL